MNETRLPGNLNNFEPTEDMPQMYWQDQYPIWQPIMTIFFDNDGKAWTKLNDSDWYICAYGKTQDDAINFYLDYGWGSKVL